MGKNTSERKLTKTEQKRKEEFQLKAVEFEEAGYVKHDLTISVLRANVMVFVLTLPFVAVMGVIYYLVNHSSIRQSISIQNALLIIVAFLILIVVHELIHGGTWAIFAENHLKNIEFGFMWNTFTPYCTCQAGLTRIQYIIGAAMPTIILGVIPIVLSIIIEAPMLFYIAAIMTLSGGGDMCIIQTVLRHKETNQQAVYMDHPYECGVVVFEKSKA